MIGGNSMYVGVNQLHLFNERSINERLRRQNAEEAYRRNDHYHEDKKDKIAQLLMEELFGEEKQKEPTLLGAGQMKQVHLPIGKTLEETIDMWQDVRTEALTVPEPTTADYQLASKASSNIRRAQAQLGLNQQANSEVDSAVHREREAVFTRMTEEFQTPVEETLYNHQQKFKRAITAYSFQVQMKLNGFKVNTPSFLKVA